MAFRAWLLAVVALASSLIGCAEDGKPMGSQIVMRDGEVYKGNVHLPYSRIDSVRTEGRWPVAGVDVPGDITLAGTDESFIDLRVKVYETKPFDVTLQPTDTGIRARSKSGKPFVVFSIEGTIPHSNLDLHTGGGQVRVSGFEGVDNVFVRADRGGIDLTSIGEVGAIDVASRDGEITLRGLRGVRSVMASSRTGGVSLREATGIPGIELRSDTGQITVIGLQGIESLRCMTGAGPVAVREFTGGRIEIDTTSGVVELSEANVDHAEIRTTSGDAVLRDAKGKNLTVRSSTGDVQQRALEFENQTLDLERGQAIELP